jgi:hypothetical protein
LAASRVQVPEEVAAGYGKETDVPELTALEYVLVGAVLLCYLAFQSWFFFYSS